MNDLKNFKAKTETSPKEHFNMALVILIMLFGASAVELIL